MRFLLVHGTSAGAWCWDRVVPEIERLGHEAVALDLPGHGERAEELPTGFASRSESINAMLRHGDVLVGHSAGGYDITIAADRAPEKIEHLIYLAAGLPLEARPIGEAMHGAGERDLDTGEPVRVGADAEVMRHAGLDERGRMVWRDRAGPGAFFLHDVDKQTLDWAYERLSPSAPVFPDEVISVPRFWAADLPRSFILCTQDKVLPPARARIFARRLGVEPLTIEASHSPFLSRPAELAGLMVKAVGTRPIGPLMPGNP